MKTTLYLDLDDVLADFKGYAKLVLGEKSSKDEKYTYNEWSRLRDNPRLYRDLKPANGSAAFVDSCRTLRDAGKVELKILTAVPKGNDVQWAFYDKVLWAQRHFPDIPVMFGPFSKDKRCHCNADAGDILIDDRISNCAEWSSAGGTAIRHLGDFHETLSALNHILEKRHQ